MKNIKVLIVGDVHGRSFWIEPVKKTLEETDAKIVFLGDYVDGYPEEWDNKEEDFNLGEHTINVLNNIIDLKYKYPDRIILLIGNHDGGYCIGRDICESRRDWMNAGIFTEIFRENWDMFQLVYEETINDIHFVFSHAGISTDFMNTYYGEDLEKDKMIDYLNNIWLAKDWLNLYQLGIYDRFRGGFGAVWASPIWADIRQMSHLTKENTIGDYQIVGHTQLSADGQPFISSYIGDFDCRECFYIDDEGNIRNYNTTIKCIEGKTIKIGKE